MIATRPDWCISRQRIWGVPIAVFMCEACNQPIINPDLNRSIVDLFEREGIEAWHTNAADNLLTEGLKALHALECVPSTFRKETDILDVWFDSGISWFAVCESDPDLSPAYTLFQKGEGRGAPEVLYLEGGDQHRGWFHSSLLTSVALRGRAPYSHVATAGWTLDEQGRAMSKSLGNGVDPVDIANRMGGEIVRLWVASVDFREDMAASENLMQRCAELYKKLRNTFRFLLGNLHGFSPARDRVKDRTKLLPLDRYMLARTRELTEKILGWYAALRVPSRLSGRERVRHRRSERFLPRRAQGPHVHLRAHEPGTPLRADGALADHRGAGAPGRAHPQLYRRRGLGVSARGRRPRSLSVHLALFPKPEEIFSEDPTQLLEEWKQLFAVRDEALRVLEEARQNKRIGKGLEAELEITASGEQLALLKRHAAGLKEIINVSGVHVVEGAELDCESSARLRPQMRPLLELHARGRRLRHLAECLHALPVSAARDGHRAAPASGGIQVSLRPRPAACPGCCGISALDPRSPTGSPRPGSATTSRWAVRFRSFRASCASRTGPTRARPSRCLPTRPRRTRCAGLWSPSRSSPRLWSWSR